MNDKPQTEKPKGDDERAEIIAAYEKRGIDEFAWRTLMTSIYPGAKPQSILMVIDYCKARKLDPLKKPCHIVPMDVKDAQTGTTVRRDVVMPGIYEQRATAMRTGLYLGHSEPVYGPAGDYGGTQAPDWCSMTMYRWHEHSGKRIEFPVKVLFSEVVNLYNDKPNSRWARAPFQMITKCAEAAGLREAFPDEIGGEYIPEEIEGTVLGDSQQVEKGAPEKSAAETARDILKARASTAAIAAPTPDAVVLPAPQVKAKAAMQRAAAQLAPAQAAADGVDTETGEIVEDRRIGLMRATQSPKSLRTMWKTMVADAEEAQQEIPIAVEAFYHDRMDQLSSGVA